MTHIVATSSCCRNRSSSISSSVIRLSCIQPLHGVCQSIHVHTFERNLSSVPLCPDKAWFNCCPIIWVLSKHSQCHEAMLYCVDSNAPVLRTISLIVCHLDAHLHLVQLSTQLILQSDTGSATIHSMQPSLSRRKVSSAADLPLEHAELLR